jgi:hypothetical protein
MLPASTAAYVITVRISRPMGGRPSPDVFGKQFHIASPIQDQFGVIAPSSLHYVATTRGSYVPAQRPGYARRLRARSILRTSGTRLPMCCEPVCRRSAAAIPMARRVAARFAMLRPPSTFALDVAARFAATYFN